MRTKPTRKKNPIILLAENALKVYGNCADVLIEENQLVIKNRVTGGYHPFLNLKEKIDLTENEKVLLKPIINHV
jgi:hypothetical protein